MPLTGQQKTDLSSALSSIASLRASLKPSDPDQQAIFAFLRRFEKELPRIQDHRGK